MYKIIKIIYIYTYIYILYFKSLLIRNVLQINNVNIIIRSSRFYLIRISACVVTCINGHALAY